MTEKQFLNELKSALKQIPADEQEDILQDIREYFANGRQDGKRDEEIMQELGPPQEIAAELLQSYRPEQPLSQLGPSEETAFDHVKAEIENGALILCSSLDSQPHIDVRDKNYRQHLITEVKDRTLYVRLREERQKWGLLSFGLNTKNPTVIIQLPSQPYGRLDCLTDNGRIEAEGIDSQSVRLKSDNGRIRAQRLSAGQMSVESDNGRIELNNIDSNSVNVKSDNGRIDLTNITGTVTAETDNGRINVVTENLERNIFLKTDNGSITVQTASIPENAAIQTKTDWGKVSIFGEKTKRQIFGNGEYAVQLKTDNGSITVEQI